MPPLTDLPATLVSQPRAALLVATLLAAAAVDMRTRRLPNVLTAGAALTAFILAVAAIGDGPGWLGALGGGALGLAFMLPLYALRVTGAGDAKLVAAVGVFLGVGEVTYAVLLTFVAGGLLALAWATWERKLGRLQAGVAAAVLAAASGQRLSITESAGHVPYAVAICAGTLACLWLRQPFTH